MQGTVMGFDFGLRRIGIAVGQTVTRSASPVTTVLAKDGEPDWQQVGKLVDEWRPAALVVGVPYTMDGDEQEMTDLAGRFQRKLEARFNLPTFGVDERLSSHLAEERLRESRQAGNRGRISKPEIDAMAACILVENFLNTQGTTP